MKHFLITSFILSVLLILGSCIVPKECLKIQDENLPVIHPVIHLDDNSPVLYQADFEVFNYHFSGLIAFRKIDDSDEIRIAFLSEMGLKLLEFSFSGKQLKNTYCSPVVQKKSILKFMGRFTEILIHEPECKSTCFYTEGDKSNYFCRARHEKVFIETSKNVRTEMHLKQTGKKGTSAVYAASGELPDEITVKMKYSTTINLKRVINAFK
jgi:hypothetical protein